MFRQLHLSSYLKFSLLAAIMYCIPVIFFVKDGTYNNAWLLYAGNGLFLCVMAIFMLFFNERKNENAKSVNMLIIGHAVAVAGVIVACILSFIILLVFVPGFFNISHADKVLTDAPANMVHGNTNGLSFMVFTNAVLGNFSAGSFVSIVLAFTAKRDQTKESSSLQGANR